MNATGPTPTIRTAIPADAPAIARFAAEAFHATFAGTASDDDMRRFLADTFSADRQGAELLDPMVWYAVAHRDDRMVGYAMLRAGTAPECVRGAAPVELARIYVGASEIGGGLGHRLFDACREAARGRGFRTLWLGVWAENQRAIRFYERHGLTDVGSHLFMVGHDAQTDRLMAGPL